MFACLWLLFAQIHLSQAQSILYAAPTSSRLEYLATLKASPDQISPTQYFLRTHPQRMEREELLRRLALAQSFFLAEDRARAQIEFQSLVELTTTADWSVTDREILLFGYLRLAQLARDPNVRDQWLSQALMLGPGLNVDRKLIPPPLVERLLSLRREAPKRQWAHELKPTWSRVLINGLSCTLENCPELPRLPFPVRVTFLSDQWQPQVRVLPGTESWTPSELPWVRGTCQQVEFLSKPTVISENAENQRQAFFNLQCERAKSPATESFSPNHPLERTSLEVALNTNASPPEPSRKPFYKSKWFYIGTAAATVATLLLVSQNERDKKDPSTTYGY